MSQRQTAEEAAAGQGEAEAARAGRRRPYRWQTRRQVLDAAFEVFGRQGIAASSLTEVAAAAGMTKGAVYSNFGSKDDLVLALMSEQVGHRLESALTGFLAAEGGEHGLGNVAAVLVREMHVDAAWHRLLAEYFALTHRDPGRREALRQRRSAVRESVERALTSVAAGQGFVLPLPADQLAVVFLALSNGLAMEADIDPGAVPDELLGQVLILLAGDAVSKR